MLLISASVRQSDIHGLGCFTNEAILKGQVVWQFDERIDIRLLLSELELLPDVAQDFYHMYGYVEEHNGQKTVVMCGDHAKHMNHSLEPNLIERGKAMELNVAAKNIKKGEELTCNYFAFDLDAKRKLGLEDL